MVVADEHALARIFSANDVTRDGVRHDSRIRESKIFRDHAAPPVGPKFDSGHRRPRESIREAISPLNSRIGLLLEGGSSDCGHYKSFFTLFSSSHFTSVPTSCARSR